MCSSGRVNSGRKINSGLRRKVRELWDLHPPTQTPSLMALCIPYAFALTHKRADTLTHNVCSISNFAKGEWEWVRTERRCRGQVRGSRWLTMLMLLLMTWLWAIIDCLHYHISYSAFPRSQAPPTSHHSSSAAVDAPAWSLEQWVN